MQILAFWHWQLFSVLGKKNLDICLLVFKKIYFREYPCDHYTAIINVTLMNTGCSRQGIRDTALQLLQLLDKRFFGCVGPLPENDLGEPLINIS